MEVIIMEKNKERTYTLNDKTDDVYVKGKNNTSYLEKVNTNMWNPNKDKK